MDLQSNYKISSILFTIFFDIGSVKDENVSSIFPLLLINILWKFHLGTAELP